MSQVVVGTPYVIRSGDIRRVIHLDYEPKKSDFIVVDEMVFRISSVQSVTLMCQRLSGKKNAVIIL